MKCPRCDGELKAEVQAGMEVDRCLGCQGLWLDKGEGEAITRPEVELPAQVVAKVSGLGSVEPVDDSAPLPCPRCASTMTRERYADSSIEIDRCGCGVWLDEGELEKITAYRQKVMSNLSSQKTDADEDADVDVDLTFSPETLERAFARIYFDVGKEP